MSNYSNVEDHRSMFFDNLRNSFYAEAIQKVVTKDSVVLDLGAGLGLHGFMATNSKAKKVYLVEPASIIDITQKLIESNNHSEKMSCIKGRIEEIDLPEKVDCIISVFTGNFLLSEDLLPSLFHARDHYLKTGGKLIPDRAKMEVVPVSADDYYAKHIDCWNQTIFDTDTNCVRKFAANTLYHDSPKKRSEVFLADPVVLLDLDFMTADEAACRKKVEVKISEDGICHGWLGWFQARVGEQWLSTSSQKQQMHWRQVFLPLSQPIQVKKGDTMQFELNRPEFGEWSWSVQYGDTRLLQSTFNANIKSAKDLQKQSSSYVPTLSDKGRISLVILNLLDGKRNTSEVVDYIIETFPRQFKTKYIAEQFVKSIIIENS